VLGAEHAPRERAPDLAGVGPLVERVRTSGHPVVLHADLPALAGLPDPVQLAAHRVVQEGLTNAMKHSPGAPADVTLAVAGAGLEVVVANDLASRAPALGGGGHGLLGLRTRVEAVGGTLTSGTDDGRFVLRASLPIGSR
jgi:signal transduction histidine kinase